MDTLRGVAVLMVVLFHAVGIPWWYHEIDVPWWFYAIVDFFGPFRMPTLVMLSGMLLGRALAKPPRRYLSAKVRTLVWPVLVWAALEVVSIAWLTDDTGVSLLEPTEWLGGGTHLWFLLYLTGYFALALVVRPVPSAVVALVMWVGSFVVDGELSRLLYYAGFFFAGDVAFRHRDRIRRWSTPPVLVVLPSGAVGLGAVAAASADLVLLDARFLPLNLAGIWVLAAVARSVPRGELVWLRSAGRNSIVYYLPHLPVEMLVVRLMLEWVDPAPPAWVLVVVSTVGALAVGWTLVRFRHSPAVRWMFEWPFGRVRASGPPVSAEQQGLSAAQS